MRSRKQRIAGTAAAIAIAFALTGCWGESALLFEPQDLRDPSEPVNEPEHQPGLPEPEQDECFEREQPRAVAGRLPEPC